MNKGERGDEAFCIMTCIRAFTTDLPPTPDPGAFGLTYPSLPGFFVPTLLAL
jgi:hypothetical protein